ncbi:MAG: hypothetical protein EXS49_01375 [Candidatus Pacebacteria bacterium]|nr:hypothetical protein [Candidatus Paceibacterota bacterium]
MSKQINKENSDQFWNSTIAGPLSMEVVVKEIISFMKTDEKMDYKLIIGSDSLLRSEKNADFVTAIVIYKVGNGARYFWRRIEGKKKFHTLRDRMFEEVLMSLDIAQKVLDFAKEFNAPKFSFEIHLDIGEKGPTRNVIQELTGMIRAMNFEPKIKPMSFAASNVADKHI